MNEDHVQRRIHVRIVPGTEDHARPHDGVAAGERLAHRGRIALEREAEREVERREGLALAGQRARDRHHAPVPDVPQLRELAEHGALGDAELVGEPPPRTGSGSPSTRASTPAPPPRRPSAPTTGSATPSAAVPPTVRLVPACRNPAVRGRAEMSAFVRFCAAAGVNPAPRRTIPARRARRRAAAASCAAGRRGRRDRRGARGSPSRSRLRRG